LWVGAIKGCVIWLKKRARDTQDSVVGKILKFMGLTVEA